MTEIRQSEVPAGAQRYIEGAAIKRTESQESTGKPGGVSKETRDLAASILDF